MLIQGNVKKLTFFFFPILIIAFPDGSTNQQLLMPGHSKILKQGKDWFCHISYLAITLT